MAGPSEATPGDDYQTAAGTLIMPPGATSATVTVTITGDPFDEPDETFLLSLTQPLNLMDYQSERRVSSPSTVPAVVVTESGTTAVAKGT